MRGVNDSDRDHIETRWIDLGFFALKVRELKRGFDKDSFEEAMEARDDSNDRAAALKGRQTKVLIKLNNY